MVMRWLGDTICDFNYALVDKEKEKNVKMITDDIKESVLSSLLKLSSFGLMHRDLSLSNLLMKRSSDNNNFEGTLIDFGNVCEAFTPTGFYSNFLFSSKLLKRRD